MMEFHAQLGSPLGRILLSSTADGLAGLYFIGQKDCPHLPGMPAPQPFSPASGELNGRPIRSMLARRQAPEEDLFGEPNLARTIGWADHAVSPEQSDPALEAMPPAGPGEVSYMQEDTPQAVRDIFIQVQTELGEYFAGQRHVFSVPLRLEGTPFQQRVWQALLAIPYGEYVSYGDVAVAAGMTRHHGRPVGAAVGQNPITIIVPCHRVLASSGRLNGYSSGLDRKVALLELEGFEMQ